MLRAPTQFVELGTSTNTTATTPLIKKFHNTFGTTTTTNISTPATNKSKTKKKNQQQQQQQTDHLLYYEQTAQQQSQTDTKLTVKQQKALKKNLKLSSKASTTKTSSSSSVSSISSSSISSTASSTASIQQQQQQHSVTTNFIAKNFFSSTTTAFSFMRLNKKARITKNTTTTTNQTTTPKLTIHSVIVDAAVDENNDIYCEIPRSTPTTPTPKACDTNCLTNSYSSFNNNNNNNHNNYNNLIKSYATTKTANIPNTKATINTFQTASFIEKQHLTSAQTIQSSKATTPITSPVSTSKSSFGHNLLATTTITSNSTSSPPALSTSFASSATATIMSPTSQTPSRTSLFDSCHRKIRLIGGGPVAFLGGLVAKARRKDRDGDQNPTDTKLYLEESVLERKLPEADLKALVDLPAGLDYNEWLASHTLALFEHVNLVYGTISEFCTPPGCPDMTGPGNRTYLWFDEKGKKTRVAAPQYIDYVMIFTQKTVSDESIFPTKYANEFPSSFESIARKILRLQFHVIAHLYAAHFREIALLGLHTHLNLTFAHLTALHRRFNLIDEKETDVLRDLEVALRLTDDNNSVNNPNSQQTTAESGGTHSNANASNNSNSSGNGALSRGEDVNSHQPNHTTITTTGASSIIDGDAAATPICTQPEATAKTKPVTGGGGLVGGILGDLTSGEFGDNTTRYCTSAVPHASSSSCNAKQQIDATAAINCNNGAGALHLNSNNNIHHNNHMQQHNHHHPHPHVHPHHLHSTGHQQQQQQHTQNSGLIQCNASNAPNNTAATSTTTA